VKERPIVKYTWTLCGHLCENGSADRDAAWAVGSNWPRESRIRSGSRCPHGKVQFWGKGARIVKYRDLQKWLNRSICRLGGGLGWAEGSTISLVFARWRQCALMGGHIGTLPSYHTLYIILLLSYG